MAEVELANKHVRLREAVAAAKLGHKSMARRLFRELVESDPRNEEAWLWSAALAETPDEAHRSLVKVLDINPNNHHALNALALQRLREAALRQQRAELALDQKTQAAQSAPATAAVQAGPVPRVAAQRAVPEPAAWHCPLCNAESSRAVKNCPRCGALLTLESLDDLAASRDVDENTLLEAIQRILKELRSQPTFEGHLNLARAYLNLNRSAEALPHLEKASQLKPGETSVKQALEKLRNRRLILAVDDSTTVRKIVAVTLERYGYRVLTAMDGMQALAKLDEQRPDLILLDITMPRMDGYQVCKTIKQNAYTKPIPVLMLSGKDGFFDKVKGKLAGATDYLTKPFQEEALVKAVEKHLKPRS
ncbi:response regulator [uncultured Paludibaculum sp.]|uniref:response regulator n=1 Tax=uncultured Paludibaculum sp. TaxID=1765020 RepID=UPI002AAA7E26|nr:response regulator [uncultured Paludibaculum sp.]